MGTEREKNENPPIACTLTEAELAAMKSGLLPGLLARAVSKESIPGGFRWRFEPHPDLVRDAAAVIDAEHRCCQFLLFCAARRPRGWSGAGSR